MANLSDIELFYTPPESIQESVLTLSDEEFHHAVKVMRNSFGDDLYVTDGNGKIFHSIIYEIKKDSLTAKIKEVFKYKNSSVNIFFCIPKLKNPERLKFAVEKSAELGITRFIVFESMHTISKSANLKRLEKIALAAMKQSLRSFLPQIEFDTLKNLMSREGNKFLFDQNAENSFEPAVEFSTATFFIFGPEGGFDKSEIDLFPAESKFKLANNRLRTETAVVKCAALLNIP